MNKRDTKERKHADRKKEMRDKYELREWSKQEGKKQTVKYTKDNDERNTKVTEEKVNKCDANERKVSE